MPESQPPAEASHRRSTRLGLVAGPAVLAALLVAAAVRFVHDPVAAPPAGAPTDATGEAPTTVPATDPITALQAATAARPGDPDGWRRLGAAQLDRALRTNDPADHAAARAAYERVLALLPDDTAGLVGLATIELSRHRFAVALDLARRALAVRPRDPAALAAVVDAEVELGLYDAAETHTQQLLDARPALAALSRASYQRELRGDLAGALTAMVQAEGAGGGIAAPSGGDRSELATVVALQGDILWTSGDLTGAGRRYQRALDLAPDLPLAVVGRARVEAATGRVDEAIARLRTLVGRAPVLGAAVLLADLEAVAQRPGTGAELVDAIGRLQRAGGADVDLELAVHLADTGRPDPALARAAYAARPSVHGADALAWTLFRAGDLAAARPLVDEALRLGTADPALRFHAAAILAANGERARAAAELRRVAATNPWFSPRLQSEVEALAADLGVTLPASPA